MKITVKRKMKLKSIYKRLKSLEMTLIKCLMVSTTKKAKEN